MQNNSAPDRDDRRVGRNRQLVFDVLSRSDTPMSAYQILGELREEGLRAPLQVYRALDRLIEEGLVHKIESLSAFALCTHDESGNHGDAVFMICDDCGRTNEIHDAALGQLLAGISRRQGFRAGSATIELSGQCEACASG